MKLAEGVWDRDDYVAGEARRRGQDLNALFADPEVDVVQALQGGFGSAQAIPYLDFDGAILFFEDTHTPPYYVDGQLVQLAHAGKLEQVAGVVVGQMVGLRRPSARVGLGALAHSKTSSRSGSSRSAFRRSTGSRSGMRSTSLPFRSASSGRSTPTPKRSRSTSLLFAERRLLFLLVVDEEAAHDADDLSS